MPAIPERVLDAGLGVSEGASERLEEEESGRALGTNS